MAPLYSCARGNQVPIRKQAVACVMYQKKMPTMMKAMWMSPWNSAYPKAPRNGTTDASARPTTLAKPVRTPSVVNTMRKMHPPLP
eukprot:3934106-Rhodomonas_salina.1